jgi:predicted nucleotidyltransferase
MIRNDLAKEYNEKMNTRFQEIENISRKYRVKIMYVFGSRSAEIYQAIQNDALTIQPSQSDLDIGIQTKLPLSIDEKVGLALELEEFFGVTRVDLVVLQETDAFLAANIIRGERIFAENSYEANEYELYVLRRAGDLAELERRRIAMILQEG